MRNPTPTKHAAVSGIGDIVSLATPVPRVPAEASLAGTAASIFSGLNQQVSVPVPFVPKKKEKRGLRSFLGSHLTLTLIFALYSGGREHGEHHIIP
jgi:hypothetical protein